MWWLTLWLVVWLTVVVGHVVVDRGGWSCDGLTMRSSGDYEIAWLRGRAAARCCGWVVVRLRSVLYDRLCGCMVAWLHGCVSAIFMAVCLVVERLCICEVVWLNGCMVA